MAINVGENQRGNVERTIQRHCYYWAQDTEQRQTKKNNNTEYYKDEHCGSHQKNNSGELGCSERVSNSCFLQDTHHVTHIVTFCKSLSL